jgi:hypothetical protein
VRFSAVGWRGGAGLWIFVAGVLLSGGCARSVKWRLDSFDRVQADSRVQNKLTFVYFRNWYSVECTRFEESVLKDPAVLDALLPFNCVPLDFDRDRPLAEAWGIQKPPAFVVVDGTSRVMASGMGAMSVTGVLDALRRAREGPSSPPPASTAAPLSP